MLKKVEDMSYKELTELLIDLLRKGAIYGDDTLIDIVLNEVVAMRKANMELMG